MPGHKSTHFGGPDSNIFLQRLRKFAFRFYSLNKNKNAGHMADVICSGSKDLELVHNTLDKTGKSLV
jgi:hypothetical protein